MRSAPGESVLARGLKKTLPAANAELKAHFPPRSSLRWGPGRQAASFNPKPGRRGFGTPELLRTWRGSVLCGLTAKPGCYGAAAGDAWEQAFLTPPATIRLLLGHCRWCSRLGLKITQARNPPAPNTELMGEESPLENVIAAENLVSKACRSFRPLGGARGCPCFGTDGSAPCSPGSVWMAAKFHAEGIIVASQTGLGRSYLAAAER